MTAGRRAGSTATGVLAVGLFAWWSTADGGYAPGAWYPGALLLLAALAATARPAGYRALASPGRVALLSLAAFTVWSFCSIAWADARGIAWDGANRTLLYLTVFALFAVGPWAAREAALGLGAFALAIAALGGWAFVRALAGSDAAVFVDGRLAAPIGYENATAALLLMAFWAAVMIAVRAETRAPARAVLFAAAGVLLDLTVLAQSRGSLVAGAFSFALAFAFAADRWRLVVALGLVVAPTAVALPVLLAVYDDGASDLVPAALAIGASAALLAGAGAVFAPIERWAVARRRVVRPRAVAAAALAVSGVALAFAMMGGPLTAPGDAAGRALDSRFAAGPGTGRYDFWRVAALEFLDHPIGGVGADNFAHDYVRDRRGGEQPLYPHSVIWRTLGQTGVVGTVLLATFGIAVLVAARRAASARRAVAAAALAVAGVWVAQGSIDWLWEMPAVGAPAMASLGLAVSVWPPVDPPPAPGRRRIVLGVTGAALVAVAALSLALPALAARDIESAVREWRSDPSRALDRLDRAHRLNPLGDRADLAAGALSVAAGDAATARRSYAAALARDDRNWQAHAQLALLDLDAGRREAAVAGLRRARELNPHDGSVAEALAAAQAGEPPPGGVRERLAALAMPGPIRPHPVDCGPVLGLGSACGRDR